MLEKNYNIKCRTEGENSSYALRVLKRTADLWKKSGDYSNSEKLYKQLYSHILADLENQDFGSLNLLKAAADYYAGKGEYLKAIMISQKNCEITFLYFGECESTKEFVKEAELLLTEYMKKYAETTG